MRSKTSSMKQEQRPPPPIQSETGAAHDAQRKYSSQGFKPNAWVVMLPIAGFRTE